MLFMKGKFLFFVLFLSSLFFGQEYRQMLDHNSQWNLTYCYYGCNTDTYHARTDTVVDGYNYKILDGFHYISRKFLLREEVSNKRIYLKLAYQLPHREFLLYDFSLNEGDIFAMSNPVTPFPERGGNFVLDSIRQRPLHNAELYRHFYFSPTPDNTISNYKVVWIEGIGSTSMINAPGGKADIDGAGHLTCYFNNSDLVYSNYQTLTTCQLLNVSNHNQIDFLKIQKTNSKNVYQFINANVVSDILLYNSTGVRLKSTNYLNEASINYPLNDYPSGVYLVAVLSRDNKRKVFKVLLD